MDLKKGVTAFTLKVHHLCMLSAAHLIDMYVVVV